MTWELIIPGIAVGLFMLALGIEFLMHDREKAKKVELAIRKKQKEVKKLQKEKDTKAMMAANKELMGLMSQNFRLRMKTMMISMPMFLIILWLLNGMLNVAPLTAGADSHVGFEVKNLAEKAQSINAELVSADITVTGNNSQLLDLDDQGDQGDRLSVWWIVTAGEGSKFYSLKLTADNKSEEKPYAVKFSPAGALSAGFTPETESKLLDGTIEVKPIYKGVEVNILGMTIGWFWYYFVTYMLLSFALMPVKNRVLWGHHKGIKHIEKMENEKASMGKAKEPETKK